MAHSPDGIHWTIDKAPKAYSRTVEWEDGKVEMQGHWNLRFFSLRMEKSYMHFFATMNGLNGFENATKSRNMVIPLK